MLSIEHPYLYILILINTQAIGSLYYILFDVKIVRIISVHC